MPYKIETDFIDAIKITEEKGRSYLLELFNSHSERGFAFMVPKDLFDKAVELKSVVDVSIRIESENKGEGIYQ